MQGTYIYASTCSEMLSLPSKPQQPKNYHFLQVERTYVFQMKLKFTNSVLSIYKFYIMAVTQLPTYMYTNIRRL